MTTAVPATRTPDHSSGVGAAARRRMDPWRKVALAGGIAYLVSFAASIPQLALYADLVDDPAGFISSAGSNTAVRLGSFLEVVTAFSCIATAFALYPAIRRVSRTAAIGFVTSRVVEASLIVVGVMCVLAVVTLKADYAGASGGVAETLGVTGAALIAMRQWTFLLGPGLIAGINGLFLGYAMYRGRLVPRWMPTLGLVGAPLILMSSTVTIFGGWGQTSAIAMPLALPIAAWEFSIGIYLTFKGFKNTPTTATAV